MDTAKSTADPSSAFLDKLPPEIRNTIYRLVLVDPNYPLVLTKFDFSARKTLIDTCKQIRSEAKDIILAENTFAVVYGKGDGYVAARWLASLGERARMVKRLSIVFELSEETKKGNQVVVHHSRTAQDQGVDTDSAEFEIQRSRVQNSVYLTFVPESVALAKAAHASVTLGQLHVGAVHVQERKPHAGLRGEEAFLCVMSRICELVIVEQNSLQLHALEERLVKICQNACPDFSACA